MIINQFSRYFILSLIGYIVDLSLFIALVESGFRPFLSNMVAFVCGATINAVMFRYLVFENPRFAFHREILLSLAVFALINFLASMLIEFAIVFLSISIVVSKIMVNSFSFVLNYGIRRRYFEV